VSQENLFSEELEAAVRQLVDAAIAQARIEMSTVNSPKKQTDILMHVFAHLCQQLVASVWSGLEARFKDEAKEEARRRVLAVFDSFIEGKR